MERYLQVNWLKTDSDYDKQDLRSMFEAFGPVEDVIIKNQTANVGSALVIMSTKESTVEAIKCSSLNVALFLEQHATTSAGTDRAGCRAGNPSCRTRDSDLPAAIMACNKCPYLSAFCHSCCCILCHKPLDLSSDKGRYICCKTMLEGVPCEHIGHLECGVRCCLAGTMSGALHLDAEYICFVCKGRTDLVPCLRDLFKSCEAMKNAKEARKLLNLCVFSLRGSTKASAMDLLQDILSAAPQMNEEEEVDEEAPFYVKLEAEEFLRW